MMSAPRKASFPFILHSSESNLIRNLQRKSLILFRFDEDDDEK